MELFDEQEFIREQQDETIQSFLKQVEEYDESQTLTMLARGFICKDRVARTVTFAFGEVTIWRKRWRKKGRTIIPVDEWLALEKYARYSKELVYRIGNLATRLPYRQVCEVLELISNLYITKDVVHKTVRYINRLLNEKENYRYYKDQVYQKKKVEVLYIEGDGVMFKTRDNALPNHNMDYAHFVIHEGVKKVGKKRFKLKNKKEIIALSPKLAREELFDYIYNHYEVIEETILITNSDGGHGYTPAVFQELAKGLKIKYHEHFWDEYHLHKDIHSLTRRKPQELRDKLYKSVRKHDIRLLSTTLDTLDSLIQDEKEQETFDALSRKLITNFAYTKPARLRGFKHNGIGIIESQHRKFTYRMKHRGMYWSIKGGITVAKAILLLHEKRLRHLFFGKWRDEYQEFQKMERTTGGTILKGQETTKKTYRLRQLKWGF